MRSVNKTLDQMARIAVVLRCKVFKIMDQSKASMFSTNAAWEVNKYVVSGFYCPVYLDTSRRADEIEKKQKKSDKVFGDSKDVYSSQKPYLMSQVFLAG
jgi:hypothetical protein